MAVMFAAGRLQANRTGSDEHEEPDTTLPDALLTDAEVGQWLQNTGHFEAVGTTAVVPGCGRRAPDDQVVPRCSRAKSESRGARSERQ